MDHARAPHVGALSFHDHSLRLRRGVYGKTIGLQASMASCGGAFAGLYAKEHFTVSPGVLYRVTMRAKSSCVPWNHLLPFGKSPFFSSLSWPNFISLSVSFAAWARGASS